uniref:MOB kinase activator 3B n=1 Tax=Cyprinus carpio carpio TaxID=630221 RepID=A0A8C1HWM1_CYPCA
MSIALKQVFNKDKTFRPKRRFEPGTQRFELHKRAQASLSSGLDLRAAVKLPQGEDLNDWVAVHVVDFFNRINLIYGTVCEFCTEKSCPVMSGGPRYEYRWQDEHKYKKPTPLPAPQYMNLLMDWIEMQINNEDIFPTSIVEAPPSRCTGAAIRLSETEEQRTTDSIHTALLTAPAETTLAAHYTHTHTTQHTRQIHYTPSTTHT